MIRTDLIQPFSFPEVPVRGQLVQLETSWQAIRGDHDYPPGAERLLGEMVVIVAMLAHGIKLDGSVVLQTQSDGPLRTAMAECTGQTQLRGILRFDPANGTRALHDGPLGDGHLAITLRPTRGEPYQGIVPLAAGGFARSVERYFDQSEQLPTRIRVTASHQRAAGLLVQRLPASSDEPSNDWQRLAQRVANVAEQRLLDTEPTELLRRVFARDVIRAQPARTLKFGCSCSRDRAAGALRAMGHGEVLAILETTSRLEVACEFCGAVYDYDPIDALLLFQVHAPQADEPPYH